MDNGGLTGSSGKQSRQRNVTLAAHVGSEKLQNLGNVQISETCFLGCVDGSLQRKPRLYPSITHPVSEWAVTLRLLVLVGRFYILSLKE